MLHYLPSGDSSPPCHNKSASSQTGTRRTQPLRASEKSTSSSLPACHQHPAPPIQPQDVVTLCLISFCPEGFRHWNNTTAGSDVCRARADMPNYSEPFILVCLMKCKTGDRWLWFLPGVTAGSQQMVLYTSSPRQNVLHNTPGLVKYACPWTHQTVRGALTWLHLHLLYEYGAFITHLIIRPMTDCQIITTKRLCKRIINYISDK